MQVETSTTIPAPPEDVWRIVMDPFRLHEWVSIHRDLKDPPPGPLDKGSSFVQKIGLGGRAFDVRWTVRDFDEPRRAVWEGAGPAGSRAQVEYEMRPEGRGTRFSYTNNFKLPGGLLGRLAGRVISRALMRREARKSLSRLKALVQ